MAPRPAKLGPCTCRTRATAKLGPCARRMRAATLQQRSLPLPQPERASATRQAGGQLYCSMRGWSYEAAPHRPGGPASSTQVGRRQD
eukprot:350556-Chlamydomonas_euryale.AAC.20